MNKKDPLAGVWKQMKQRCRNPKRVKDISGQRFGRLQVVDLAGTDRLGSKWNCVCDCGNLVVAYRYKLVAGAKKSCGCLWVKNGKYANGKGPQSKLCGVWKQLKQRCGNPNNKDYRYYGARGVMVCEEWQSFRGFESWALDNGYQEGLTIDRIDGDGNYEPSNCQWISQKENARKQRRPEPEGVRTRSTN